ncbi:hypothetical protein [Nocardia sp. X0981]
MTGTDYRQPEGVAEFAEELRLLAEAVLERVEPVLRAAAEDGRPEWNNCTWCPVCAAAALVRGEHHEVLAAVAAHGTAIVTVLREALAGTPVDPIVPHEHRTPAPDRSDAAETADGPAADTAEPESFPGSGSGEPDAADETGTRDRSARTGRSRYIGIPVNIKR